MIAQTNIKFQIESFISHALETLGKKGDFEIKRNKKEANGHYSSNIGFILTQLYGQSAMIWAGKIISHIPENEIIKKIEIGGLGFLNFFLKPSLNSLIIGEVLKQGPLFGYDSSYKMDSFKSYINDSNFFYITQYAHARICIVLRQLKEAGVFWDKYVGLKSLDLLQQSHEISLISLIRSYPEVIKAAACAREPHQLAYYLRELANDLHSYYNNMQLLSENESLNAAGWCLLEAARQVLSNGLRLLGVSAPESM